MIRLSQETLHLLPAEVAVPSYNRERITPGIVHIGIGGFHRAHEAVYTDALLAEGGANDWGICGIGLRPEDRPMRDALIPQDCLYTVVTRSAEGDEARVVGSLVRYLFAPEQPEAVRDALASPRTRIVSLTITEGGYGLEAAVQPDSVFAWLAEALRQRRLAGIPPFTVLSCDNLPHNGGAAKRALLAAAGSDVLGHWIEENVAFPSSMVDRITPQTTDADRALVQGEFGIDDAWPVVCEPFKQWIIEDNFSDGRPPWEQAGAQFVPDVAPYETMKLGLLNGSHFAMAYLGFLAGFTTVPALMADPDFRLLIQRLMDDEVSPLLPPVPGIDLADYKATLIHRFDNPAIKDQISRLCLDGSGKFPQYLLPSLRRAIDANAPRRLLTLTLAGWMHYLSGEDEQDRPYVIDDPRAAELTALARQGGTDPRPLLAAPDLFTGIAESEPLAEALADDLTRLGRDGVRATLNETLFPRFAS